MESTDSTHERDIVTQLFCSPVVDMLGVEILELEKARSKVVNEERQREECQAPVLASMWVTGQSG